MMLGNTFEYLKNIFTKKSTTTTTTTTDEPVAKIPNEILLMELDYTMYPQPRITNPDGQKTILVVDDYDLTNILFINDMRLVKEKYNREVSTDFRIIACLHQEAGFQAYKVINIDKHKIDYAILDLTLGNIVRLPNGDFVELNGPDIAIELLKTNPDVKIVFCTAHTMNKDNATIAKYADKLRDHGIDLFNNVVLKNSENRYIDFYKFLYPQG